jgi:hypothetical protein
MAIEITSFKPFVKNTLQGFATIRLTNIGLEIRDVCLHQKNDRRWIQLPARPYEKGGQTLWSPLIEFFDKSLATRFQKSALDALDQFLAKGKGRR